RVSEHAVVSRLRPQRVPLSGGSVPGQLLWPTSHRPASRSARSERVPVGRSARSPLPCRVALIASSSWSHAFLTRKNYLLYPDIEADRTLYNALQAGDYAAWRERPLSAIEDSGPQGGLCLVVPHGG